MIRGQFCTLNSWEKASSWCSLSLKNFTKELSKDEGKKYIIPDISLTWICLAKERFLHPHFRMWESVNQFYLKLKLLRLFHRYQIQSHGRKTSQTENRVLHSKLLKCYFDMTQGEQSILHRFYERWLSEWGEAKTIVYTNEHFLDFFHK